MRGGQYQVVLLLHLLSDAGIKNVLLARPDAPLYRTARDAGFPVYPARLANVIRHSRSANLVHVHDAHAHTLAALGARKPFVVSRRVAFPPGNSPVSCWKYKKASRYLAVSNFVARQLEAAGIRPEQIDVVYDAVNTEARGVWDPAAPAVALASDDPGKCRPLVAEASRLAGIPVVFSDDLSRDLKRASMFVYLSRSEGLGSAALLALTMGIPIVASRVEGMAEVFDDGISGLYTANNAAAVAGAMRRILDTPGLAEKLILAGCVRAQSEFSPSRLLERTVASYQKVLA